MRFRLAHLSDAHIGPISPPSLRELMGKRVTGYANWLHKRAAQHDMALLGRLVDDLLAQAPDHVAMTGDIVNIGLDSEIEAGARWLRRLGDIDSVSFSPGNHDVYTPQAAPAVDRVFAPWTTGEDGRSGFPYLRRRGGVALIGLSSGVPTAPFIASGRLGAQQCDRLAETLQQAQAEGLARVVLLHHPPYRGGARMFRGLDDAADFEAIIARYGAELVLHGHNHRQSVYRLAGPSGSVPVVGVASASARPGAHTPGAAYHLFEIEKSQSGWRIEGRARGASENGETIGDVAMPPLK